ncbi:hypothetical protein TNCV_3813101 [Trichonephila clavipes]|nr:hypothetical protein TNCV_3813101 [Trichonephila clavipes]
MHLFENRLNGKHRLEILHLSTSLFFLISENLLFGSLEMWFFGGNPLERAFLGDSEGKKKHFPDRLGEIFPNLQSVFRWDPRFASITSGKTLKNVFPGAPVAPPRGRGPKRIHFPDLLDASFKNMSFISKSDRPFARRIPTGVTSSSLDHFFERKLPYLVLLR